MGKNARKGLSENALMIFAIIIRVILTLILSG